MPVALTIPPTAIAFSRNPIPVQLYSSDYLDNAGAQATCTLTFSGPVNTGDTLSLQWANGAANFSFVLTPDDSGTQLPTSNGTAAYVTALIAFLQYNFYLDSDFSVAQTTGTTQLVLTAKNVGIKYSLTAGSSTTNLSVATTPGQDVAIKPNFKHLLQVWQSGGLASDTLLYNQQLQLDYPVSGITSKDLQEILHTYLDYDVPAPGTVWQSCQKSFMAYYLRYAQVYGDTAQAQRVYKTGIYYAFLGGYSNVALNSIGNNAAYLQTYLLPNPALYQFQRWFEAYPVDNISVRTNQPMFLYFINNRAVAESLDIAVTISFNTGAPVTTIIPGGALAPYNKVCIDCSYLGLGLNAYTTSSQTVVSYTVGLVQSSTGDPRSLVKTFVLDRSPQQYTRYIIYSDSAGNFKTLNLFGKSQASTEVTDALANRFADANTPKLGNIDRYNILSTENDAINTGYISASQYDALKELLLARKAFRVFGNALVPIIIKTNKFDYSADGKNLNAMKLEYQLAYQEAVYTADTGALPVLQLNSPQNSLNI